MRPVTVIVTPAYIYHTPGSLNGNVPFFFAPSGLCTVYNQLGGFQRTIRWCGDQLLDKWVLGNALPNPSNAPTRLLARNLLQGRLEDIYTTSRLPMAQMIGDYCSFCELPLGGHLLATEHRSAKDPYPTFTVWWWNFALACRDCNSIKGQQPARATVIGWSAAMVPTEDDLYNEIEARYYWPNIDVNTYRRIRISFWMDTQGAPVQLTGAEFSDRNNIERSFVGALVRANVWQGGVFRLNRYVEAQVYNRKPNPEGARTLTLTGLSDQDTARSALRTRAWLTCCLQRDVMLNGLAVIPNAHKDAAFTTSWTLLLMTAVLRGFYSTWVRVLSKRGFPAHVNAGGFANLAERFVHETQAGNAPNIGCIVPGTDVTKVP
jgi:hypothetical protein